MATSKKPKKTNKPKNRTQVKAVTSKKPEPKAPSIAVGDKRKLKESPPKFPRNMWPLKKREKKEKVKVERIEYDPLPSSVAIFGRSIEILRDNWVLFLGIVVVYGILNIILVRGFATGVDLTSIKADVSGAFHGSIKEAGSSVTLFIYLLGGTGNSSNASAGAYQSLLVVVVSLTLIWALREIYAGIVPGIRESYYKACYALVPLFLIMLVVAVECVPFVLGALLFSVIVGGGIAVDIAEKVIAGVFCFGLMILTLRWLCSSLFALYIVTLPDMTPMAALRSARNLVRFRRLEVFRKILFLPLVVLIIFAVIITPFILFITPLAAWVLFFMTMAGLAIIHSYMYTCYREML